MSDSYDKKVIVWDLDDVLYNFTEAWLKLGWQAEHPECHIPYGRLRSNPPLAELNTTQAEYLDSLDRFRMSAAARNLAPNPVLLRWFESAGGKFRHAVLTARPVKTVAPAAEWVFAHFGRWIRDFHFVPSPRSGEERLPASETTKAEVLARLGAVDFFVDDSPQNVQAAEARGIRGVLFPQPWNESNQTVQAILQDLTRNAVTDHLPLAHTLA
jgi:FMN phosphatase YigB (HAD superfamily)